MVGVIVSKTQSDGVSVRSLMVDGTTVDASRTGRMATIRRTVAMDDGCVAVLMCCCCAWYP